jgi:hypothetical protein
MASSIPGAVAYWVNLAETTLKSTVTSPDGVYVWFGSPLSRYIAPITLQVMEVTEITHQWAELGSQYKIEETYKIHNQLVSFAGDNDQLGRMNEVFSNLQLLTVALANDYTLGGNVRLCLPVVEGDYLPGTDASGRTAGSLTFDIHCEARVTSLT